MSTLLLSDLHLPEGPSPLRRAFQAFLDGPARAASAVYLLGDIFEYWIGDDIGARRYAAELDHLARLTASGVPAYFISGNRDFMVGSRFCRATGVRSLPDPQLTDIEGVPTLLSHGDLFCTGDRAYQRWRRFSRNPAMQGLFMMSPARWRQRFGDGLRGHSQDARSYRPADILDVDPRAIERAFRRTGASRLIHGHTHRPALHRLQIDNRPCQRLVLADWRDDTHEYLEITPESLQRRQVDFA